MMMKSSQSPTMFTPCWEFVVIFACTWLLTLGQGQDAQSGNGSTINCNDTKALDVCWSKLPPMKDNGIPTTPEAVDRACKVFDTGMECVNNWAKACLTKQDRDKVMGSVVGAMETYRFLCTDRKFRRDFLKHADCYKRISPHWDECARKFIASLKRVDHGRDILALCCIRVRYLHCVTEVASSKCTKNATQFLQRLAESLVRTTMRSYHPSQCSSVSDRNCSDSSSAQTSTKFFSARAAIHSSFLYRILSYPTEQLINSVNVLRSLQLSDISTFFSTLPGELSYFFNHQHTPIHHHLLEQDVDADVTAPNSCFPTANENNNNPV